MEQDYLNQLSEKEKVALEVARLYLGDSYSLKRSIGYITFVKKNEHSDRVNRITSPPPVTYLP